jgi:hypothetical protein
MNNITDSYHIVLLGDPHLPGKLIEEKYDLQQTINQWSDVDLTVVLGDSCHFIGEEEELFIARGYYDNFTSPLEVITGNHDYLYTSQGQLVGERAVSTAEQRAEKLEKFCEIMEKPQLHTARDCGKYRLLFLSTDHLESSHLSALSDEGFVWLEEELIKAAKRPVIIFYHAPLWGPEIVKKIPELESFVAQPEEKFRELVEKYENIFLWIAGHLHLSPHNPHATAPHNFYQNKVQVINVCDIDGQSVLKETDRWFQQHKEQWTHSLFLDDTGVRVKVFHHGKKRWVDSLERFFPNKTDRRALVR